MNRSEVDSSVNMKSREKVQHRNDVLFAHINTLRNTYVLNNLQNNFNPTATCSNVYYISWVIILPCNCSLCNVCDLVVPLLNYIGLQAYLLFILKFTYSLSKISWIICERHGVSHEGTIPCCRKGLRQQSRDRKSGMYCTVWDPYSLWQASRSLHITSLSSPKLSSGWRKGKTE